MFIYIPFAYFCSLSFWRSAREVLCLRKPPSIFCPLRLGLLHPLPEHSPKEGQQDNLFHSGARQEAVRPITYMNESLTALLVDLVVFWFCSASLLNSDTGLFTSLNFIYNDCREHEVQEVSQTGG